MIAHRFARVAILAAALVAATCIAGEIEDSPELRSTAADRYLAVADLRKQLVDGTEAMAQTLPEERRALFKTMMLKHVRLEVLAAASKASLVRNFTTRELNALADFYGSPDGKSALVKLSAYMADIMPILKMELSRAATETINEMQRRSNETQSGT